MKVKQIKETKHKELLSLLNPLVDFMAANNYSYFLVAGKNGLCSRHIMGNADDVHGMVTSMMEKHEQVKTIITDVVMAYKGEVVLKSQKNSLGKEN